jgi:hypothetical protein
MRVRVMTLVVVAVALLGADSLLACGDKFLPAGRSAKFRQAYAAIYPASVVVYARPQRGSTAAIRDPHLLADLKSAGHSVTVVEDAQALARALETSRIDVLFTDGADADHLATQASTAPAKPRVVPVLFKPTKPEAKAVETQYTICLTSSDRSIKFLGAIDEVMKAKKKKT